MEIDDLLNKANGLLSFDTGKKQSRKPSRGSIAKADNPLAWKLYTQGSLGPRIDLPSCFWNFREAALKDIVIHMYEPIDPVGISRLAEIGSVVLHGHAIGVACPYGQQCHLFPCTGTESAWGFKEKWKEVYDEAGR